MKQMVLNPDEQRIAQDVIAQEEQKRSHLVIALSGAHAYGFPSADSDLDLKGVHIESTERLLGLLRTSATPSRMETIENVCIDYSSNELHPVLIGILQGNGNYIERILGPITLFSISDIDTLRVLCKQAMSRRIYRHYLGFATSQLRAWEATGRSSAKKLLYVLRTTLTGVHALRTGELVTNLEELADTYHVSDARELIDTKRAGEKTSLSVEMAERWTATVDSVLTALDAAHSSSILPEEPPNANELNDWLLAIRKSRL